MALIGDRARHPFANDWEVLAKTTPEELHAYVTLRAKFIFLIEELDALPLSERVELMTEALEKAKAKKQAA